MRLLLDTHVLLWLMDDNPRLTKDARSLIIQAKQVYASSASAWEVSIKCSLGKLETNADKLVELISKAGLLELPVTFKHAVESGKLPFHHRDPFDRILIAQAVSEHMHLLTCDSQLRAYSDLVEYR